MNSKRDGNIEWRKNERFDEVELSFPIFEEACILIRVPTSICQGLAINADGDCLLRNSLWTNTAIYDIIYRFWVKGIQHDGGFPLIVVTSTIKLYIFFCRSLYQQISDFLSCNFIVGFVKGSRASLAIFKLNTFASLELNFNFNLNFKD